MQAEEQQERRLDVGEQPLRVTSYRIGRRYSCRVDNIDPGAIIGRASADTREEAERVAVEQATSVLSLRASTQAIRGALNNLKTPKR